MRHIHLDPLGGVAGDMFVAAMLHAFPQHAARALDAAKGLSGADCTILAHDDGVLTGQRFHVEEPGGRGRHHHHGHDHHGGHTHWSDIRARIAGSELDAGTKEHATGIFAVLADAEARVHGVAPDDVAFHEVGAADSIADIVAAASIIAAIGPATWSISPLPLGSGRVATAHGPMPVPAPATALLLQGFATLDDGIAGERVTPTGAAILRHLNAGPRRMAGTLGANGIGFGTRKLAGISNCLRVLVLDTEKDMAEAAHRELSVIAFEVDDQSGEDLAAGLDRIRLVPGVHDLLQSAAIGKKGRMAIHVQVLAAPCVLEQAVAACFQETTTIGLRTHLVQGRALPRRFEQVDVDGHIVHVKRVDRPGGATGKAEADHALHLETHAARARLRRRAEEKAL